MDAIWLLLWAWLVAFFVWVLNAAGGQIVGAYAQDLWFERFDKIRRNLKKTNRELEAAVAEMNSCKKTFESLLIENDRLQDVVIRQHIVIARYRAGLNANDNADSADDPDHMTMQ